MRYASEKKLKEFMKSDGSWALLISVSLIALMIQPFVHIISTTIASLSVAIFFTVTVYSIVMYTYKKTSILLIGAIISLVGALTPAAMMFATNPKYIALPQNPLNYLRFVSQSELKNIDTYTYKNAADRDLQITQYSTGQNVIVMLHAGGWQFGSPYDIGMWPRFFADNNYAVYSVEYRLSRPDYASWSDTTADIRDAMSYLRQDLDISSDRIILMGQSAGAHLALLEAHKNNSVSKVISLYGPTDLQLDYDTSKDKSSESTFIGGSPDDYPRRYELLSPIRYISKQSPPTLLIHGKRDDLVHHNNTLAFSNLLDSKGITNEVVLLPLTGHSFDIQEGGIATEISKQAILRFLQD